VIHQPAVIQLDFKHNIHWSAFPLELSCDNATQFRSGIRYGREIRLVWTERGSVHPKLVLLAPNVRLDGAAAGAKKNLAIHLTCGAAEGTETRRGRGANPMCGVLLCTEGWSSAGPRRQDDWERGAETKWGEKWQ
jgi:hypothetical protein